MRSVTIKISAEGKTAVSGSNLLGYGGEHNASSLIFQFDSDALLHFEGAQYYRVAVDGAFSDLLQLQSGKVVFTVPGELMVPPSVNVQLIGYKQENDEIVLVAKCAVAEVEVGFSEEYRNDAENQPDVFDRYLAACDHVYEQAKEQAKFSAEYAIKATEQAEISTVAAARSENAAESADVFAGMAEQHSLSAKNSADAAQIYAEQGKTTLEEFKSINFPPEVYANAIKGKSKGEIITLRDVSPVAHTLDVSIEGEIPYETVIINEGRNYAAGEHIEFEGRRKIEVEYELGYNNITAYVTLTTADADDQSVPVSEMDIPLGMGDVDVHGNFTIYIEGSKVYWNGVKTITSENDEKIYFEGTSDIFNEIDSELYEGAVINGFGFSSKSSYDSLSYLKISETVKTPITLKAIGKNLLRYPYENTSKAEKGIAFTVNSDGSLTVEGTNSASSNANFSFALTTNPILFKAGTYTFSAGKKLTQDVRFRIGKVGGGNIGIIQPGGTYQTKITFTLTEDTNIFVNALVPPGAVIEKETFYPQIEMGSAMTDFEPYKAPVEYTPNADGTVEGVKSIYPVTTLLTDTEGITINAEYNKDTNKVIESLVNAIIALGGNV